MLNPEQIEQTFTYKADLSDVYHLASGYFDWISTLISQAKSSGNHTFLDIAEYLADSQSVEFLENAKSVKP